MGEKVRLELLGITYNQIESGVYALILRQKGGTRRIPIIIGFPEAQAIECRLQEIATPRPLTHDMTLSIMESFNIMLKEVFIHQLDNGVFAADLVLTDGISEQTIDARSSDAIAMAIRCDAPIYTTAELLRSAGFDHGESETESVAFAATAKPDEESLSEARLADMTESQLEEAMAEAAKAENYEEAARIKAELERRRNNDVR
ncbi:MAG: bifunctional nuclease family protein [Bacteroidales bacterium]|nr:bifunctional nuclease family protein [Bacteroidales bacterium]MBD5218574.1 bifunctional nuclease family protein [Bacteroidales bacterium]MBD5221239.1 bifunctional nuclease family protein [Bacteroidales bacterium]